MKINPMFELGQTISNQAHRLSQRSYYALLEYELNATNYDRINAPSLHIPVGERMIDYAIEYNTTIDDMKKHELEVDRYISKMRI